MILYRRHLLNQWNKDRLYPLNVTPMKVTPKKCYTMQWNVTPMKCYTNEMLHQWNVTPMKCYTNEMLHQWNVTPMKCYTNEIAKVNPVLLVNQSSIYRPHYI